MFEAVFTVDSVNAVVWNGERLLNIVVNTIRQRLRFGSNVLIDLRNALKFFQTIPIREIIKKNEIKL